MSTENTIKIEFIKAIKSFFNKNKKTTGVDIYNFLISTYPDMDLGQTSCGLGLSGEGLFPRLESLEIKDNLVLVRSSCFLAITPILPILYHGINNRVFVGIGFCNCSEYCQSDFIIDTKGYGEGRVVLCSKHCEDGEQCPNQPTDYTFQRFDSEEDWLWSQNLNWIHPII